MDLTCLEARVTELERRCRRLQLFGLGTTTLLASACLSGALAPTPRTLRAERFELVNARDEVRGQLELHDSTPRLVLVSPENESIVALCAGPSIVEHRPGKAWFTETGSGFDVDEGAEPEKHGLATLTLGARSSLTELVVDQGFSGLVMDASGPLVALKAGTNLTEEEDCVAGLQLLAERPEAEGSFGHANFVVGPERGLLELGANDLVGVELRHDAGKPSLTLKDAAETVLFHAP